MFKSKLILLLVITFSLTSCLGGGSSGDENPTNQTDDGGSDDDSGNQSETGDQATTVEGELTKDTIWSGVVEAGYVVVPEGVTLTIQPGTKVKFRVSRDYKNPNKGGLGIEGGTLKAIGEPGMQIFFTSDYEGAGFDSAINGDWFGISLSDTDDSELKYTVVEFAELGVEQFNSSAKVSYSVIRWNNTEGLYAEQSSPTFEYNTLYQNAYHEIALEQDNTNVQIKKNLFQYGYVGIHSENTQVTISDNFFEDYASHAITAGMGSDLAVSDNHFLQIEGEPDILNTDEPNTKIEQSGSINESNGSNRPAFNYPVPNDYDLGYRPAIEGKDQYQYVYESEDDTRKVTYKLGKGSGLKFGWALHYYDNHLWRFSLGGGEHGDGLDFIRINPATGEFIKMATDFAVNPRGLTHDGTYFWVNDFSEKKLFRFKPPASVIEGGKVTEVTSFNIPEQHLGGTMGLTFDGADLLLVSRDQSKLYRIDPDAPTTDVEVVILSHTTGNDITWHDGYLWSTASDKGLGKFEVLETQANLVGSIYPVAYDAWAITSNGKIDDSARLWTLQKTVELWDDDKLFEIQPKELLDP